MMIRRVLTLVCLLVTPLAQAAEPMLEHEFTRFEETSGGTMGIAALHLDVGQVKTAVAVLRMIYKMKFNKPVPVPG